MYLVIPQLFAFGGDPCVGIFKGDGVIVRFEIDLWLVVSLHLVE